MISIPDVTSTKILMAMLFVIIGLGVLSRLGMELRDLSMAKAARVCQNSCMPREGVVVGDTCFCENQGLALVPIETMIPDTGLCPKPELVAH